MHDKRHRRAAGNAALEESVMALHLRSDSSAVRDHSTQTVYSSERHADAVSRAGVQDNKAIVGRTAFATGRHSPGTASSRPPDLRDPAREDVGDPESLVPEAPTARGRKKSAAATLGFEFRAMS